jgi:hypothetical protein
MGPLEVLGNHRKATEISWWPLQIYQSIMVATTRPVDIHGNYFLRSVLHFILFKKKSTLFFKNSFVV